MKISNDEQSAFDARHSCCELNTSKYAASSSAHESSDSIFNGTVRTCSMEIDCPGTSIATPEKCVNMAAMATLPANVAMRERFFVFITLYMNKIEWIPAYY